MTNEFLYGLAEINLAIATAVSALLLLRWPLRKYFGAQIAYAFWLVVPATALATLIPAKMVVLTVKTFPLPGLLKTSAASPSFAPESLLVAAWATGALLLLAYFARSQLRFQAAMRDGKAGPAVAGVLRPQIVTPSGFRTEFTSDEQAIILAHERTHLFRQDARINAAVALLRCLCWFNPLVHVGARTMRIDQEMACDAVVLGRAPGMRRVYAEALLKTQMTSTPLPLGCYWPGGTDHPLMERIAMLKVKHPGSVRRAIGVLAILLASGVGGWSAWAAQSPRVSVDVVMDNAGPVPAALVLAQNTALPPAPAAPSALEAPPAPPAPEASSPPPEPPAPFNYAQQGAKRAKELAAERNKMTERLAREQGKIAEQLARTQAEMAEKQATMASKLAEQQAELQAKLAALKVMQETKISIAVSKIVSDALLRAGNALANVRVPVTASMANEAEYERALEKAMEESFGDDFEKKIEAEVERALKASDFETKVSPR
jgi:beta-lactamase regulating signal transducer with metallopeptidase domain